MSMRRVWMQTTLALAILAVVSLGGPSSVSAQDGWSWIFTPQLWGTHIEKNGFVTPSGIPFPLFAPGGTLVVDAFRPEDSEPVESIYPQWGAQLAAQRGRWTLAGSFQYVSFETRSDIIFDPTPSLPLFTPPADFTFPGDRVAQEFLDTTRIDIDLAASYAFPDVISNRLDLSIGGGVKVIYAEATREFSNLTQAAAFLNQRGFGLGGPGLYFVCPSDDCSDVGRRQRVKTSDVIYGATIPMSATVHLTNDSRWLLPINITPFLGAETRDDRDVVYKLDLDPSTSTGVKVDRLDGTTFAYGVTADVTARYLLSDTVSIYGGGRVQYINGHEEYLAYGPIIGMSVRFGGK